MQKNLPITIQATGRATASPRHIVHPTVKINNNYYVML